jgi:hypothetical protein
MATSTTATQTAHLVLRSDQDELSRNSEAQNRAGSVPTNSEYLTQNGSPTGLEPDTNPQWWPDDHRRIPPHRAPVVNPEWNQIAGETLGLRIFFWTMISGCQLEQVGTVINPDIDRSYIADTSDSGHTALHAAWDIIKWDQGANSCIKSPTNGKEELDLR